MRRLIVSTKSYKLVSNLFSWSPAWYFPSHSVDLLLGEEKSSWSATLILSGNMYYTGKAWTQQSLEAVLARTYRLNWVTFHENYQENTNSISRLMQGLCAFHTQMRTDVLGDQRFSLKVYSFCISV